MQKQKRLMPRLRFPRFEGEWMENKLIRLSANGFSNGAFNDPRLVGSGYRIINVKDMYIDTTINVENLKRVALSEKEFLSNRVFYGDLFFTRSSLVKEGIAFSNVNLSSEEDLTFDGHLIKMSPDTKKCISLFLYYHFKTTNSRKQFIVRGKTTTMTTIGQDDISDVLVMFPTLPEQQKIANFLTTMDTRIQSLEKKKSLLEQYKKAVMQQIFKQEIRFRDAEGAVFPKWDEKMLGEIIQIQSSKRVLQKDWKESGIPFYRTREIINLSKGEDFRTPIFISTRLYEEIKAKYGIPKVGDLLVTGVGSIGETYIVKKEDQFYFKDGNVLWFKLNENVVSEYLDQAFKTRYIIKQLSDNASITTVATFTIEGAKKTRIKLPSKEEQTKIADFLSAIDKKIGLVGEQIEKTKTYKKGLLQQMFV